MPNLCFLQIFTKGNVVHRGRPFYRTATIFNRDPFDQVVKETDSNPDVMGSNPMTSRFFAPRGILCVDKIESPENPQHLVGANVGANVAANVGANP